MSIKGAMSLAKLDNTVNVKVKVDTAQAVSELDEVVKKYNLVSRIEKLERAFEALIVEVLRVNDCSVFSGSLPELTDEEKTALEKRRLGLLERIFELSEKDS